MKTKLTLSMEKDLVQYARRRALRDGRSISAMFSDYLRIMQSSNRRVGGVSEMTGSLKKYHIDDSKQAIASAYAKKHSD